MADQPAAPSPTRCMTPIAIACYAYVWQPRPAQDPTKAAQYSITLLFDKAKFAVDGVGMKTAARAAIQKKFGDKPPAGLKNPFRDGETARPDDPMFKGKIFVSARSKEKPGIVNRAVQPITNEMEFYSGCECICTLNAFYYDNNGNKGVSFALANIQKVSDGPRLSGRRPADQDFKPLPGGASDHDDLLGDGADGDDIPF